MYTKINKENEPYFKETYFDCHKLQLKVQDNYLYSLTHEKLLMQDIWSSCHFYGLWTDLYWS